MFLYKSDEAKNEDFFVYGVNSPPARDRASRHPYINNVGFDAARFDSNLRYIEPPTKMQ